MDAGKTRLGEDSAAAPHDGPLVGLHDVNARRGPGGQGREQPEPEVRAASPAARGCADARGRDGDRAWLDGASWTVARLGPPALAGGASLAIHYDLRWRLPPRFCGARASPAEPCDRYFNSSESPDRRIVVFSSKIFL